MISVGMEPLGAVASVVGELPYLPGRPRVGVEGWFDVVVVEGLD